MAFLSLARGELVYHASVPVLRASLSNQTCGFKLATTYSHTSYDRYGNRTGVAATGTAADSSPIPIDGLAGLAYDNTTNRITTSGFEYDVAGNQVKAPGPDGNGLVYIYDSANRLHIILKESDSSYVQAFQYGSTNARLMDMDYIANHFTMYASVGGTTLAEYAEYTHTIPTWTKTYTYLGDSQLATVTPNGSGGEYVEFNHPDRLGTKLQTNQAGGTAYEQNTLPFGTALNAESTLTTNNKRFTSYDRSNATNLDYAINRTYDSKQGRFTQVDPIGMGAVSLAAPQTLNMYTYCGNDPVNYTDPMGLFFGKLFKWIGKIFKTVAKVLLWVAVVVGVILLTALIMSYTPWMLPGWLGNIVGSIIGVLGKIGAGALSFMAGAVGVESGMSVGFGIAAGLFSVGAIANGFSNTQTKSGPKTRKFCQQIEPYIAAAKPFFEDAWRRSNAGTQNVVEQGGLVHQQGQVLQNEKFTRKQRSPGYTLEGFDEFMNTKMKIPEGNDTNSPRTIFWYHTHPYEKGDELFKLPNGKKAVATDPNFPSKNDRKVSRSSGLYGVAISSTSIVVFNSQGRRCRFDR